MLLWQNDGKDENQMIERGSITFDTQLSLVKYVSINISAQAFEI